MTEQIICHLLAYGKVFLVRKNSGHDVGQLYAMKVRHKKNWSEFPRTDMIKSVFYLF